MKFCFVFLLLLSCATTDVYFTGRINKVKQYCKQYGSGCEMIDRVQVYFTELDNNVLGKCDQDSIKINNRTWDDLTPVQQEVLLLHEYGHCAFNKDDTPNYANPDASLMYPVPLEVVVYYQENKKYFLTVLFF